MSESSQFNKVITLLLEDMKPYFERHSHDQISIPNQQLFTEVVKATIIKSYEFVASINQHHDDYMFFSLPSLRGICEEYIVEKFIAANFSNNKDEIILLRHTYDHLKSCIVQWKYFETNRPDQRLYYEQGLPEQLVKAESELKAAIKSQLPGIALKPVFPSIYFMSTETGERELYDYLYHASSTFVHFSPNNLLRMGWGKFPQVHYSTSNFKLYYKDFALFYSLLLLSKLCAWQEANGFLPDFNREYIKLMDTVLSKAERWPELVTFEEMNIGALSKNLFYKSPNEAGQTG